jgi:hypothetical protein
MTTYYQYTAGELITRVAIIAILAFVVGYMQGVEYIINIIL